MTDQNQQQNMMRYAGLATQWLAMLGVTVYAGIKLDHWLKWKIPVCTIVLPMASLVFSIWQLIRELGKPKK